jgi:hypothetical protein
MKTWLRPIGRMAVHLFDEKPYIPGMLKAACGYVTYRDMLVKDDGRTYDLCKKCKSIKG